jgi:hypothetical protein
MRALHHSPNYNVVVKGRDEQPKSVIKTRQTKDVSEDIEGKEQPR